MPTPTKSFPGWLHTWSGFRIWPWWLPICWPVHWDLKDLSAWTTCAISVTIPGSPVKISIIIADFASFSPSFSTCPNSTKFKPIKNMWIAILSWRTWRDPWSAWTSVWSSGKSTRPWPMTFHCLCDQCKIIGNVQLWFTSWQFCPLDGVLIITPKKANFT